MTRKIVSDSSSNILELEGIAYESVPLKIITEEKEYVDNTDLDVEQMVQELLESKGKNSTACPNVHEFERAFEGAQEVFVVTITSALSGSFNAASIAADRVKEAQQQLKIHVIDTLSAGPEPALIIEKLKELLNSSLSFEEIKEKIEDYRSNTHLLFTLESLANLAKNGRVSPVVAKMAGILGIRHIGIASDEGTLKQLHNVRGMKRAVKKTFEEMKNHGFKGGRARIAHCMNLKAAGELKELIVSEFSQADVLIENTTGLCSYYAEKGGLMIGFES